MKRIISWTRGGRAEMASSHGQPESLPRISDRPIIYPVKGKVTLTMGFPYFNSFIINKEDATDGRVREGGKEKSMTTTVSFMHSSIFHNKKELGPSSQTIMYLAYISNPSITLKDL